MMVGKRMIRLRQVCGNFNFRIPARRIRFFCVLLSFLPVFSTVFVVNKDLAQGVISGKYFWFYGSMVLAAVATFVSVWVSRRKVRMDCRDWLVAGFCVWVAAVSYFQGGNEVITTKLSLLLLLLLLYFCLRIFFVRYKNAVKWLSLFIVLGGLAEAVWGLLQLYGFTASQHHLFKTTGSFFNPGPYAGYLAVVLPLALEGIERYKEKGKRSRVKGEKTNFHSPLFTLHSYLFTPLISSLSCISILLVLPAAMSRAAWLAAITGCAVVIYKKYAEQLPIKQYYTKYKKQTWFGICLIILIFLIFLTGLYYLKKDSADGRLLMWKTAIRTATEHPLGVGLGHFPDAYGETQAAYFAGGQASETEESVAGSPEYGFNEYLQIAVESGIAGLLLFLSVIILVIRNYLKNKQYGLLGSLVALLVFACFSYPFSVLPFPVVLCFLLAAAQFKTTEDTEDTEFRFSPCSLCPLWLILFSTVSFFIIVKQYPVYKSYKQWKHVQYLYHSGLYRDAGEEYAKLYPDLNDRINFLFEYGRSLSNTGQYEESNKVLRQAAQISCDPMLYNIMGKNYQAMKDYRQAETCFIHAAQIVPKRLYPWYLLAKLYDEMGLPDKVRETAAIVLTKEPKVQSTAIREMREEVLKLQNNSKNHF